LIPPRNSIQHYPKPFFFYDRSLPRDGAGRLRGDVVDSAVDAFDLVEMRFGTKKFWAPRQVRATLLALAEHAKAFSTAPPQGASSGLRLTSSRTRSTAALRDFDPAYDRSGSKCD
jgi:hypothetical protein